VIHLRAAVIVYFPNFAPIEWLAEREEKDWSRSARCADRGRPPPAAAEEAPCAATRNSATIARR